MTPARVPRHVAIIMDGNGRWAARRGHSRFFGHVRGASRVKGIVREADRLGVQALTLFAFSTENWSRPDSELSVLWTLLKKFLLREEEELARQNVRLRVIGEVERLGADVRKVLDPVVERLSGNTGLQLNFAISYGSRKELARAARLFAEDCARGIRQPGEMTESMLENYLWTADLGELADVDLVIRTSGEQRTSNFLLWQSAYAEYVFMNLCWPDFTPDCFRTAVAEFSGRERRFGGLSPVEPALESAVEPALVRRLKAQEGLGA
jgi:undecaprenyl diphosphate synthase